MMGASLRTGFPPFMGEIPVIPIKPKVQILIVSVYCYYH